MARRLETLWHALVSRKRVTLRYRGAGREEETERAVDPWGLCLRRGVWVLVGFCHLRQARRTFHVDRISEIRLNPLRPRSPDYDLPAQFDISDVAREQVWEHPFHDPVEVVLSLDAELAPMAERLFPNSRVQSCDSGARVIIAARYLDGLLRQVLSLGEGARVVSPERAVERLREMLDAIQSDALPEEHTA
jgi:proteasome accessory factor B